MPINFFSLCCSRSTSLFFKMVISASISSTISFSSRSFFSYLSITFSPSSYIAFHLKRVDSEVSSLTVSSLFCSINESRNSLFDSIWATDSAASFLL